MIVTLPTALDRLDDVVCYFGGGADHCASLVPADPKHTMLSQFDLIEANVPPMIGSARPSPMDRALREARAAAERGEVPIGAVIVTSGGVILAEEGNRTEQSHDPTAHAEMLAIRAAAARMGAPRLVDCDLYVTLEPCPMCAQAISFARIRRLYWGAADSKGGGVEYGPRIFDQASCHHRPELYSGINERESAELLREFFKLRR